MTLTDLDLSRAVSHALRHKPWLYELELDEEGFGERPDWHSVVVGRELDRGVELDPMVDMPGLARFFIGSACFVESSLAAVGQELLAWRGELGRRPRLHEVRGGLLELLPRLSPLTVGASPRELLVSAGSWTAYFNSAARATDPSTVSVLSRRMGVRALKVSCAPDGMEFKGMRYGPGLQFHLWGPEGARPLGYVRTIDAIRDDNRWVFEQSGQVTGFEEPEQYSKRRVRERFTPAMLGRYCAALGIDLFDLDAYGPDALLLDQTVVMPPRPRQVWL